jgi:acylphosphatase
VVHGHVQAVGFRASCLHRASEAGLAGWVRNTEAGDVEAVFEGPPPAVAALVAWCRAGPSWARVDGIDVYEEPIRGQTGFSVR